MKSNLVALFVGALFGLGLTVAGMTLPAKIIGFLDVLGEWDPALIFVMAGAIGVHFFAYRMVKHRTSPFLADKFMIPDTKGIDRNLVVGSFLFGVGWALGGYCPGPAITSLISLKVEVLIFVTAMTAGMYLRDLWPKNS